MSYGDYFVSYSGGPEKLWRASKFGWTISGFGKTAMQAIRAAEVAVKTNPCPQGFRLMPKGTVIRRGDIGLNEHGWKEMNCLFGTKAEVTLARRIGKPTSSASLAPKHTAISGVIP